jgi:hypothetical protein
LLPVHAHVPDPAMGDPQLAMIKKVPIKNPRQKVGKCIFCGQKGGRTRTHVWPEWLKTILPDSTHRVDIDETVIHLDPDRLDVIK